MTDTALTADEQQLLEQLQAKAAAPAADEKPAPPAAKLGETVLYTLTEQDAVGINARRKAYQAHQGGLDDEATVMLQGYQEYRGNAASEGQQCPAVVVRDWGGCVNLQVLLDGLDTWWATSVSIGSEAGLPGRYDLIPAAAEPTDSSGGTHTVVMQ